MKEEYLRQIFRYMNKGMVLFWRLGMEPLIHLWPEVGGRIMVITHTGRKSALRRQTPVNYALIDDDVYCVAGFGSVSDWYRNILAHPQVEVWLPQGWWAGEAVQADEHPDRLVIIRQALINSGFAAHVFGGINPKRASDAELEALVRDYRLVRIRREQARTGAGGPADLVWVWPALAHILLLVWLFKRTGRRNRRN